MKVFRRLVLSLYALFIALVTVSLVVGIAAIETEQISFEVVSRAAEGLIAYKSSVLIIMAILVVLLIISMRIVIGGTGDRRERDPIIKNASGGEIEISLDTFESIAISTLKKITDARDYSARVRKINEDVTVLIKMAVIPDINIPELGEKVQTQVTEAIESTTGVKVQKVKVKIENISPVFKSKVE